MARCPECAGKMTYNPANRMMVCNSCGLSLNRNELDRYWSKVRDERGSDADVVQREKNRRKEWLDWYSKSKDEKRYE
jgi:transcription initiation factor TFIIIB Brf1 subunit/transcription initiation factor TFIIB